MSTTAPADDATTAETNQVNTATASSDDSTSTSTSTSTSSNVDTSSSTDKGQGGATFDFSLDNVVVVSVPPSPTVIDCFHCMNEIRRRLQRSKQKFSVCVFRSLLPDLPFISSCRDQPRTPNGVSETLSEKSDTDVGWSSVFHCYYCCCCCSILCGRGRDKLHAVAFVLNVVCCFFTEHRHRFE